VGVYAGLVLLAAHVLPFRLAAALASTWSSRT